ncbi:hypothetical protein ACH5RR_011925 [Cinchona calisaya]|uniref:Uncharacterized protein n=1 Tax=Cinchona calisaya TaxID=153742 RepID=A0ABD3A7T9_9GENT
MSDPRKGACQVLFAVNPIISMSLQVSCILVISHFFHLRLKPFGQPGPVAQILRRQSSPYILIKLTYVVHKFVLPVYFGYSGFRAVLTSIDSLVKLSVVFVLLLLSFGGKIIGTLAACSHLKIPLNEGVLIAFLMNLKSHADLLTLSAAMQDKAFMVRRESDIPGFRHIAFESQNPECELRLLTCVRGLRSVGTMVRLAAAIKKMNEAVDIFSAKTGVMIHQIKVVSPFVRIYLDWCKCAEDVRASSIILPFHKHQRIDGKLENSKEGKRTTN